MLGKMCGCMCVGVGGGVAGMLCVVGDVLCVRL